MSEISMSKMKKFGIFAILLFIGLWVGNTVVDWLPFSFGEPLIDTIIEWIIVCVPVYWVLKKFGRQTLQG